MTYGKDKKIYLNVKGPIVVGSTCILVLDTNKIIETDLIIGVSGTTIETLTTIYEKKNINNFSRKI